MVVSCLAPDAVMTAHEQRINGFTLTLYELLQEYQPGAVKSPAIQALKKASKIRPLLRSEQRFRLQKQMQISGTRLRK